MALVAISLTALSSTAGAGGIAVTQFDPARVARGLDVYRQFCQRCHGTELRSSGASTFDLRQFPADDYDRFIESVSEGSGDMPPHGDVLSDDEINALFAYIVTTQGKQSR